MSAGTALAQATLETTTVVGQRLEEEIPQVLERVGVRVDTIDEEAIENGGYVDVGSALQALAPGLYISPKHGPFDFVDLSYQGSRTQDILWLVDGLRINNRLYAGTTPLDTIPASMVERIEIIEGGQALFYGTQATAGVVNVVTKGFSDELDGQFTLGGGNRGLRHIDGYARGSVLGKHQFVLYASHDESDGFRPFRDEDYRPSATDRRRDYRVTTLGAKYGIDLTESLRFTAGYQRSDAKLDFLLPTLVQRAFNERDEDLLHGKIDYRLNDQVELYAKGYYHWWTSHFSEFDNEIDELGNPTGNLTTIDDDDFWGFRDYGTTAVASVTLLPELRSIFGYDFQRYRGSDAVLVIEEKTESVHALFGQLQTTAELLEDTAFGAGFRYNEPSFGESAVVWNVSGIHHWSDDLFTRATVGTAFRLPTAEELFADDPNFERGNPDLEPERSTNANLGVGGTLEFEPARVNWEVIGFWREIEDLIDLETFDEETNQDVFGNLSGKVRVRGVELRADSSITPDLSAGFDFTYNRARVSGSEGQLRRIPETQVKGMVDYHPAAWPFGVSATVVGVGEVHEQLGGGLGRRDYGEYAILNLAGRVFLDEKRRHRIGVNLVNALDDEYASRLARGVEDLSEESFVVHNQGQPLTVLVSYTFALN